MRRQPPAERNPRIAFPHHTPALQGPARAPSWLRLVRPFRPPEDGVVVPGPPSAAAADCDPGCHSAALPGLKDRNSNVEIRNKYEKSEIRRSKTKFQPRKRRVTVDPW